MAFAFALGVVTGALVLAATRPACFACSQPYAIHHESAGEHVPRAVVTHPAHLLPATTLCASRPDSSRRPPPATLAVNRTWESYIPGWGHGSVTTLPPRAETAERCALATAVAEGMVEGAYANRSAAGEWVPCACVGDAAAWSDAIDAVLAWWPARNPLGHDGTGGDGPNEAVAGSVSRASLARTWRMLHASADVQQREQVDAHVRVADCAVYYRLLPGGWHYAQRTIHTLFLIQSALTWLGCGVADMEFLLSTADVPARLTPLAPLPPSNSTSPRPPTHLNHHLPAPVLGMTYLPSHATVPVPDFSFLAWREGGVGEEQGALYPDLMAQIMHASTVTPYHTRRRVAVFRGQFGNPDREALRRVMSSSGVASLFDTGLMTAGPVPGMIEPLPLVHHVRYAVQLYVAGNGYSARFKYLLATGSPVVALVGTATGAMTEWWTMQLQPWVHYVPAHTADDIPILVQWLLDHPATAEGIGAAGQAWVEGRLTPVRARCYTWLLLAAYQQRWVTTASDAARPVGDGDKEESGAPWWDGDMEWTAVGGPGTELAVVEAVYEQQLGRLRQQGG